MAITANEERTSASDGGALISTGSMGGDIAISLVVSELIETYIVEKRLVAGGARRLGSMLVNRGLINGVSDDLALAGAKQAASKAGGKAVTSGVTPSVGANAAGSAAARATATGAKFASHATNVFSAATFAFSIAMVVMDIMDKNGYNIILGPKDLEEIKKAYDEVYHNQLYTDVNERQDFDVESLIYDLTPSGYPKYSDKWGEMYWKYYNEYLVSIGFAENWFELVPEADTTDLPAVDENTMEEYFRYFETKDSKNKYITWGISFLACLVVILIFGFIKYGRNTK